MGVGGGESDGGGGGGSDTDSEEGVIQRDRVMGERYKEGGRGESDTER